MRETLQNFKPITLESAGLPFVITGPTHPHRRVLVRSPNATLDLIGLEGLSLETINKPSSSFDFLLSPEASNHIMRNIVVSDANFLANDFDDRKSYLAFAWRGAANQRELDEIRQMFKISSADLHYAMYFGDKEAVEIILSPIVLRCELANESYQKRNKSINTAFKFSILFYALLGAALFTWKYFAR